MKSKTLRRTLAIAMSAATLLTSAVSLTAFATDTDSVQSASASNIILIEDHSVVDCTHYYKENGNYYFQIKCPKGELEKIDLALTCSSDGGSMGSVSFKHTSFTGIFEKIYDYSDDTYDYTWFVVKCSEYPDSFYSSWAGMGIKIFYFDGENSKMATNTSNYSTEQGKGYWLSKDIT